MEGLQLKFDIQLWREDDEISNFERDGEEGTFLNELGESKVGSISEAIRPLHMFVFAKVALALNAAPDRQAKELVLRSLTPVGISIPLAPH